MIEIRSWRDRDEAALIALWDTCGLSRPWNPPAGDIALIRRTGHGEILVAADGDEIVGSVVVGHDGHRGWVYYLAVAPTLRRGGLGRRLMRMAEAWAAARGVRKLELMVRDSNEAVAGFYERIGYAREPVLVMSRWLDGTQRQGLA
ncbi:MAG TPA: GNAT family acetyltransferase [Stellaceae bacterium]|nr:GNAT family acetyltransferase [Stellaceae bacterium]